MDYGAKYIRWAPFAEENPEPAGKLPNYGTAITLGALNKVSDAPAFNEAKGYGDNALKVHVIKFKECPITVEVTTVPRDAMAAISGAEIEKGANKNMWFGEDDKTPYGGFGFLVNLILDSGEDVCMGVFFPKTKAMLQGTEYNTNGENITLATGKLQFTASSCNAKKWRGYSDYFDTEEEAMAWIDGIFAGTNTDIGKGGEDVQSAPARTVSKAAQV